jgi:hypothetical protein
MSEHRTPVNRFPTRTVLVGLAAAASTIWLGLAGAGAAEAKSHHHGGNPFSGPAFSPPAKKPQTVHVSSTPHQNVVRPSTMSIVVHTSGTGENNGHKSATGGGETAAGLGSATTPGGGPKSSTGDTGHHG